jgi:O-antigen/teichoic acid export membrane protein
MISEILGHTGFQRYFKNTSWMMGEQALRMIAGLFVGIWVARYLGPEQFGLFSYVLAFTALFSGISKLGLDGILVHEIVIQPNKRDVLLGTAFWLKVFGALLVIVLIALTLPFTSNDGVTSIYIFIIAAGMLFQAFEVIEFYFQSQVLAKLVSTCKVIQLVISSFLKIILVLTESKLIWFFLVALFDTVTLAFSLFIAYKTQKNHTSFYRFFDISNAKYLLKYSWPLILSSIIFMIHMRIDQIIIKEMLGEYEVGIYSAAIRLSEVWFFIPVMITSSLFPSIIKAKKYSGTLYVERLQWLYTFMVWLAICIALPITFLSNWLVTILYGAAYSAAGKVLMIHIWSGVFVFLSSAFGKYLIIENITMVNFYRVFYGAIINILLNLIFIPRFGIVGSAYATLISLFTINIFYDVFIANLRIQLIMKLRAFFSPIVCIKTFFIFIKRA